jgi:ribosomal protein S12 methylthiotransferase accessory factor
MGNLPDSALAPSLKKMSKLMSRHGLVSRVAWLPVTEGEPNFPIYTASLGNPGEALGVQTAWRHDPNSGNFDGAGGALDRETAAHLAIAESLERYSSCSWDPDELIWASANELGDDAIPPSAWPTCSETELSDVRSGLIPSDPRVPIRWTRAWSVTRGAPVFVPAAQVYLQFPPQSPAERYTHPVSTGCAAHGDVESAITNGILEVVERDSIALTWLQQLRLPRLEYDLDDLTPTQQEYVRRATSTNIKTVLFDATTDLGIPVIYGLQLADHDSRLAQMVVATCDTEPGAAIAKLHREAGSLRIALRALSGAESAKTLPADPNDTVSVVGGALINGVPERRDRFSFLLDGERETRKVRDMPSVEKGNALPWLLERLADKGCEVIVVDITTDEARQVGATVVKVLIPQLMPLSFAHRARYLGHPRLYSAPAAMGLTVHPENAINPNPQPFA